MNNQYDYIIIESEDDIIDTKNSSIKVIVEIPTSNCRVKLP